MIHTPIPICVSAGDGPALHVLNTRRFKTARLSVLLVAPAHSVRSPLGTLLFGVLRRGSERYPRLALLNRRLDELYGTTLTIRNFLHGDEQVLAFTAEMLEDAFVPAADRGQTDILDGTMELLAQLLLHPLTDANGLLRAEAVEQEKIALCDSIRADKNDTRTYAAVRLRQIMCEGEPYGLSLAGTVEAVESMTAQAVSDTWRWLLTSARCEVFYVGRADAETVRAAWDRHFGTWNAALRAAQGAEQKHMPVTVTRPHPVPTALRGVEEALPVCQGKLCMGWSSELSAPPTGSREDLAAALVYNELLGVMQSSLLFRSVREELGLCYYCDSALDATKGILTVTAGIHPDRRAEAETAIRACVDRVRGGDISAEDVTLAKASLENAYRQIPDSPAAMEAFWFGQVLRGEDETPEDCLECILSVTREDVIRMAGRFVPDTVYFLRGTRPDVGDCEEDDDDRYED